MTPDVKLDASPARLPERVTLAGRYVTLVPLDAEAHSGALWEATHHWQTPA